MNIINKVFLILLVIAISPLFAQSDLSFGYRRTESDMDTFVKKVEETGFLTASAQAVDGGFITASRIDFTNFLVRKIKASGQKEWERTFNFEVNTRFPNPMATVNGITQTTDGGYILAGEIGCDYGCWDNGSPMLAKLRSDGAVEWNKRFSLDGIASSIFTSATPMPDGGVVATGAVLSGEKVGNRFLVVRVSAKGSVIWKKSFRAFPDANVFFNHPIVSVDNELILAFTTLDNSNHPNGVDVMRITNSGRIVWRKSLNATDFAFQSIGITVDGGTILTGIAGRSNKLSVIVLKADGTLNWERRYSMKVPGRLQILSSPLQTSDGGIVVTGGTYDTSGMKSYSFITKIDSRRKMVFQNALGGGQAYGGAVFAATAGGIVVLGDLEYGIFISKVNSEGMVPNCKFFQAAGTTQPSAFGSVHIAGVKIVTSNQLPFEALDFSLGSIVTNHSESTVCP